MMASCGVQVPMSFWPQWIQTRAAAVPLTHSLRIRTGTIDFAE